MPYKMGVVGLGVMGANLARNMASKGFAVAGYDLDAKKTREFLARPAQNAAIIGTETPEQLMEVLEKPRRILMMVPAGAAVDGVIAAPSPRLEKGDILIDGGNSFFLDTDRRCLELESAGFHFVGMGVSGGEEGALHGPSLMPGGPREAWDALAPVLRAIAAKAEDGEPCAEYMGPRAAGHYVKMVHNGRDRSGPGGEDLAGRLHHPRGPVKRGPRGLPPRVPLRTPAGKSDAGATRLLRRTHLSARGP